MPLGNPREPSAGAPVQLLLVGMRLARENFPRTARPARPALSHLPLSRTKFCGAYSQISVHGIEPCSLKICALQDSGLLEVKKRIYPLPAPVLWQRFLPLGAWDLFEFSLAGLQSLPFRLLLTSALSPGPRAAGSAGAIDLFFLLCPLFLM